MDPQTTKEGEPYAPYRYKELVRECYYITKNSNLVREDVLNMTPIEREYYIEFITEEAQRTKEHMEKLQQERELTLQSRRRKR